MTTGEAEVAPEPADVELALLRLLTISPEDDPIDLTHFDGATLGEAVGNHAPADALRTLAGVARTPRPKASHHVAAVQGLVRAHRGRGLLQGAEGDDALRELAQALTRGGDGDALLRALDGLEPGMRLHPGVLEPFVEAFGDDLELEERAMGIALRGPSAPIAQLLVELVTMPPRCRLRTGTYKGVPATLVESDACTNLPFDKCTTGVDPLRWPECSPFFLSVTPIGTLDTMANGWAGQLREEVGPGLNGSVYVTNLSATYLTGDRMAAMTFDLAPDQSGADGRVTVDHGFVATTDEGAHRRVRALKVFHITDLDVPLPWICPLWASQMVLAAWWCPT